MDERRVLLRRIRLVLALFVVALVLSGLTAIPLQWELAVLSRILGIADDATPGQLSGLRHWICLVRNGLRDIEAKYPFMLYGTDWLAFAHVVIAVAFLGPLRDPVRNLWVIHFGMIACVLVIPNAMIFGPLRGIPFYWRLIDCCFGVVGLVPLTYARALTLRLAAFDATPQAA